MTNWFKMLFHFHKWKIIKQGPLTMAGRPNGYYYDVQCEICGKIKNVRT